MTKQILTWGPWNAGLNNTDPYESIGLNELLDVSNYEITDNGVLNIRRPTHRIFPRTAAEEGSVGANAHAAVLGTMGDVTGDINYTFVRYNSRIWAISPGETLWDFDIIDCGTVPTVNDLIGIFLTDGCYWLIGETQTSYKSADMDLGTTMVWTEVVGPAETGSKLFGNTFCLYRGRLFIASNDWRVYFCGAGLNFGKWGTADGGGYLDVGMGPGEGIRFIHNTVNNLYIFAKSKTFIYTFDEDPNVDGFLQRANTQGSLFGIWFRDSLYVLTDTGLALYTNNAYYYQDIRAKYDFDKYQGMTIWGEYIAISLGSKVVLFNYRTNAISQLDLPWNIKLNQGNPIPDITRDIYSPIMYTVYATDTGIVCVPYEYYSLADNQFYDSKYQTKTLTAYDTSFLCSDNDGDTGGYYKKPFYGLLEGRAFDQIDSIIRFYDKGTGQSVVLDNVYPSTTEDCFKFSIARNRAKLYTPSVETKYTTTRNSGYYPDSTEHPEYQIPPRCYSFKAMKYIVGAKGLQSREGS